MRVCSNDDVLTANSLSIVKVSGNLSKRSSTASPVDEPCPVKNSNPGRYSCDLGHTVKRQPALVRLTLTFNLIFMFPCVLIQPMSTRLITSYEQTVFTRTEKPEINTRTGILCRVALLATSRDANIGKSIQSANYITTFVVTEFNS